MSMKLENRIYNDRFIPQRAKENFDVSHYSLKNDIFELKDIVPAKTPIYTNYARVLFSRKEYIYRLWKVVEPVPRRILNFNQNRLNNEATYETVYLWPVKPRKKPLISSPEIILDIPELDTNLCHNLIDWSQNEDIASFHDGEIVMWSERKTKCVSLSGLMKMEFCLKWNHLGTKIAVAADESKLLVVEISKQSVTFKKSCCKNKHCTISSFAWSKDDTLISGCTKGTVRSWSLLNGVRRSICKAHKGAIIGLEFSCYEQYLATSGLDKAIRIWRWPTLEHHFEMAFNLPVKAFAWHPWKESSFVSSSGIQNHVLTFWKVSNFAATDYRTNNCASIDAMTFNKNSGELVVSFYDKSNERVFIAVFATMNEIRDAIIWHLGRVPYLLWNGNNTKLLTAGSDEYICIWNFFGEDKTTAIKQSVKDVTYTTNPVKNLNIFGQCIR